MNGFRHHNRRVNLSIILQLLLLASSFSASAAENLKQVWKTERAAAEQFEKENQLQQAETAYINSLKAAEQIQEKRNHRLARALLSLADFYLRTSQYQAAAKLHERALSTWPEAFGANSPTIGIIQVALGNSLVYAGRHEEAEKVLKKGIESLEIKFGKFHPVLSHAWNRLALLYSNQGKLALARETYEAAFKTGQMPFSVTLVSNEEINIASMRPDAQTLGGILNDIGLTYLEEKNHERAAEQFLKALNYLEKELGKTHPSVHSPLINLAWVETERKNFSAAHRFAARAFEISEKTPGQILHASRDARTLIGIAYLAGDEKKLNENFMRALAMEERGTIDLIGSLPQFIFSLGAVTNLAAQEKIIHTVISLQEKHAGDKTKQLVPLLRELNRVLIRQGKTNEAEKAYLRQLSLSAMFK